MFHVTARRVSAIRQADRERESFAIFEKLAESKKPKNMVDSIADEIMTLSLTELAQLSKALNDPTSKGKNTFPDQSTIPGLNRSPFPHPKHVFAGIEADLRPGMHTLPQTNS